LINKLKKIIEIIFSRSTRKFNVILGDFMKKQNKSIFVCELFYPDTQATSILFSPLIASLVNEGREIEVLSGFGNASDVHNLSRSEIWENVPIKRCGARVNGKNGRIFRGISYVSFLLSVLIKIVFSTRKLNLIGVTNPPFLAWVLYLGCVLRGHTFTYVFLDLHPEGIIKLGMLKKSGIISRLWIWLNGIAYRKAKNIGVLGRDMIPILEENYQIDESKIFYFPHWSAVEVEAPKAFKDSDFVRKLGLSDKFVVQYSGNMGLWHDMNAFVQAAKSLEGYPDICFLFIGGGLKKDEALKLSQGMNVSNIVWHDFVPIAELTDSLSASHVSLISLKEGLSGVAVPCKLYGILSSGRCVLAQVPSNSEVAMTVLENNCGFVVDPGDSQGLAAKVLELRNDREKTLKFGGNSFLSYKEKYRISNAKDTFIKHVF